NQARSDEVLTGAVMEVAGKTSPLLVLGAQQGCGKRSRGAPGVSQLFHHGAEQQNGYGKAGEKKLKGEDAHLLIPPGKDAVATQGRPCHRGRDDENGAACTFLAIANRGEKDERQ